MLEKYVNDAKKHRMEGQAIATEAVSSNDGAKVAPADFQDADKFLKAECDDSASPIGENTVSKPILKKGTPSPQGPGV